MPLEAIQEMLRLSSFGSGMAIARTVLPRYLHQIDACLGAHEQRPVDGLIHFRVSMAPQKGIMRTQLHPV